MAVYLISYCKLKNYEWNILQNIEKILYYCSMTYNSGQAPDAVRENPKRRLTINISNLAQNHIIHKHAHKQYVS